MSFIPGNVRTVCCLKITYWCSFSRMGHSQILVTVSIKCYINTSQTILSEYIKNKRELQTFWHCNITSQRWLQVTVAMLENTFQEIKHNLYVELRLQKVPIMKHGKWYQHIENKLDIYSTEEPSCFVYVIKMFQFVNFLTPSWTLHYESGVCNSQALPLELTYLIITRPHYKMNI